MADRPQFRTFVPLVNPEAAQARPGAPFNALEVSLFYSEGGTNILTGGRQPKGYALSFQGVNKSPEGSVSFMMFTGWQLAFLVQPATRFSRATLAKIWAGLDKPALAAAFERDDYDAIRGALAPLAEAA